MNKKVMDALEAVADDTHKPLSVDVNGKVLVDAENLAVLLTWALGQRIHLQFGEEVGLTVYEEEEDELDENDKQPSRGTIVGFSGKDGVLVAAGKYEHLYYERKDVYTL